MRADRQTYRHTGTLVAILRTPPGGKVKLRSTLAYLSRGEPGVMPTKSMKSSSLESAATS